MAFYDYHLRARLVRYQFLQDFDLAQQAINPEWWELNAGARRARIEYGDKNRFTTEDAWPIFSLNSIK